MNKRNVSFVAIGLAISLLAITGVTATSRPLYTPLFTYRMEQASGEMNFSATTMNNFTYNSEKGYNLNYNVCGQYCSGAEPLGNCTYLSTTCSVTCPASCYGTCDTCSGYTCDDTSCQPTCITCLDTCETCQGRTCDETCMNSCNGTC